MDLSTVLPDTAEIKEEEHRCIEDVKKFEITTDQIYLDASNYLKFIARLKAKVVSTFKATKEAAWNTHKTVVAEEKKYLDPLKNAESILKNKLIQFKEEERRRLEEERRRLQEEEEKRARIEAQKRAEEARLQEAQALEDAGEKETAEEILSAPTTEAEIKDNLTIQHITAPVAVKAGGVSYRDNWQFEIIDPVKIPLDFLIPDLKKIGQYAKMMKDQARMDGVKFFNNRIVTARK